jgi:site-specific recombinase XerD
VRDDNQDIWDSFVRALKARNRSAETIASYLKAVNEFEAYLKADLTTAAKADAEGYLAKRLTQISATTVGIRFRSLRAFFNWMVAEGVIDVSPFGELMQPTADQVPVPVIPSDDLTVIIKACQGKDFRSRRDEAVIRVFCETGGPRLGEVARMELIDLDRKHDLLKVRGKGGKTRLIPYGSRTGIALDRYLRLRNSHRYASSRFLWLSRATGHLTPSGIAQIITARAEMAGIPDVHPHNLRHTAAHEWFAAGGSEQDAMMLFGWSSPDMPKRYGRSAAVERAQKASRRASLGDRL